MASSSDKSDLEDGEIEDGEILESESEGEVDDKASEQGNDSQENLKRPHSPDEGHEKKGSLSPPAKLTKYPHSYPRENYPRRTYGYSSSSDASDNDENGDALTMTNRHDISDGSPRSDRRGGTDSDGSDVPKLRQESKPKKPKSSLEAVQGMAAFGIKPREPRVSSSGRKTLLPAPPKEGEEDNFDLQLSRERMRQLNSRPSRSAYYGPESVTSAPHRRDSVDYRHGRSDGEPVRLESYDHGHGSKRVTSSRTSVDYSHGREPLSRPSYRRSPERDSGWSGRRSPDLDRYSSRRSPERERFRRSPERESRSSSRRSPDRDSRRASSRRSPDRDRHGGGRSPGKSSSSLSSLTSGHHVDVTVAAAEGDSRLLLDTTDRGGRPSRKPKEHGSHKKREEENSSEQRPSRPTVTCRYYLEGRCHKGADCTFSHDARREKKPELCKFYSLDCCSRGEDCLYLHEEFPCKFYHTGTYCFSGPACRFSHDPLTDETRKMLDRFLNLPKSTPDYADDAVAVELSPPPGGEPNSSSNGKSTAFSLPSTRRLPQRAALLPMPTAPPIYSTENTDYNDCFAEEMQVNEQVAASAEEAECGQQNGGHTNVGHGDAFQGAGGQEDAEEEEEEEVFIYRPYASSNDPVPDTASSFALAAPDADDSDEEGVPLMIDMGGNDEDSNSEFSLGVKKRADYPVLTSPTDFSDSESNVSRTLARPKLPVLPPMHRETKDPTPPPPPDEKPAVLSDFVPPKLLNSATETPQSTSLPVTSSAVELHQPVAEKAEGVEKLAESLVGAGAGGDIGRQQIDILKKLVAVMESKVNEKQVSSTGLLEEAADMLRGQSLDTPSTVLPSRGHPAVAPAAASAGGIAARSTNHTPAGVPVSAVVDPRKARQFAANPNSQSPSHYSSGAVPVPYNVTGHRSQASATEARSFPGDPRQATRGSYVSLDNTSLPRGLVSSHGLQDSHALSQEAVGPRQPNSAPISQQGSQAPTDPRHAKATDPRQDPRRAASAFTTTVEPPRHGGDPRHPTDNHITASSGSAFQQVSAPAADVAPGRRDPRLRQAPPVPDVVAPVTSGRSMEPSVLGPRRSLLPTPDMKPSSPHHHSSHLPENVRGASLPARADPRRAPASTGGVSAGSEHNGGYSSGFGQTHSHSAGTADMSESSAYPYRAQPHDNSVGPRRGITDPRYTSQHDPRQVGASGKPVDRSSSATNLAETFRHSDPTASPFS